MYFRLSGRHLGIITSGYFRRRLQYGPYVQRVERPRKFTGSRWNFDDTIVCTSGLAAAILESLLQVTSDDVGNRDFYVQRVERPRKYRGGRWNFDATMVCKLTNGELPV